MMTLIIELTAMAAIFYGMYRTFKAGDDMLDNYSKEELDTYYKSFRRQI